MEKTNAPYEAMLSLLAELELDESIRRFKCQRLYREIDRALATRDRSAFYSLSNEWKALLRERARQAGTGGSQG